MHQLFFLTKTWICFYLNICLSKFNVPMAIVFKLIILEKSIISKSPEHARFLRRARFVWYILIFLTFYLFIIEKSFCRQNLSTQNSKVTGTNRICFSTFVCLFLGFQGTRVKYLDTFVKPFGSEIKNPYFHLQNKSW